MADQEGCYCNGTSAEEEEDAESVVTLTFLTHNDASWMKPILRDYKASTQGRVKVVLAQVPRNELHPNIINEAISQTGLFDGYLTDPSVSGSVAEHSGWADLTPYIDETPEKKRDWSEILVGYRKLIAQYESKIIMYPMDGDLFSMFYRTDVLKHFNLTVPRTWDEYNMVAEITHGQVFENRTLVGSCLGRKPLCANAYWVNAILASMTQTRGQWSGHLFDTADMKPLMGEAMEKVIELLEGQVEFGADAEFTECIEINLASMRRGECVLTYNWGNNFRGYLQEGEFLRGKYGVAPTPGSTMVLDRATMKLVKCTPDLCPHGIDYDDIGRVNLAPYLAFGGYACAVNNYTDPKKKRLAMDFCRFAASEEESSKYIITNATGEDPEFGQSGQDPFRSSHLDTQKYVEQDYERTTTDQFLQAISEGLNSENAVIDIRFPTAPRMYNILDNEFLNHLNASRLGLIPFENRQARRRQLSESITQQFLDVIHEHDSQQSSGYSILESYQRGRGVYVPEHDYNYLGAMRIFGVVLFVIVLAFSLLFSMWTVTYRNSRIVRASQPFFLVMICAGCLIFAASIIPLGIDDERFSQQTCDRACISIPWFLACGWTIIFSAIYAKLYRVNKITRSAQRFKRVTVKRKDVLLPFAILFTLNVVMLLTWTFVDPMRWERTPLSPTSSYGTCRIDRTSTAWKIIVAFIVAINGFSLILALVEVHRARQVSTEYGESKYIGMAMVCMIQALLPGIPLLVLVEGNNDASYFIQASLCFILSIAILLFIFLPKMRQWYIHMFGKGKTPEQKNKFFTAGNASAGLQFRMKMNSFDARKFENCKKGLITLKQLMAEEGIDSDSLFRRAGLLEDTELTSRFAHSEATGPSVPTNKTASTIRTTEVADSKVENGHGHNNNDDDNDEQEEKAKAIDVDTTLSPDIPILAENGTGVVEEGNAPEERSEAGP